MLTIAEIEKELINSSSDGELALSTFREIHSVLSFDESITDQLDSALQSVEELLPIAQSFDGKYKNAWPRWEVTIQQIRRILKNQIPGVACPTPEKPSNPWKGKIGKFPLITCLVTPIHGSPSGILPAKAILLIRAYGRTRNDGAFSSAYPDFERFLADSIRKSCRPPVSFYWGPQFVPLWPSSSAGEWKSAFMHNTRHINEKRSLMSNYPGRTDFQVMQALRKTLELVSVENANSPPPTQPVSPDAHSQARQPVGQSSAAEPSTPNKEPSIVIQTARSHRSRSSGRNVSRRPAFNHFGNPVPSIDAHVEGLSPDVVHVEPQQDTPADEPMPLASVQSLDVRYSNYRSFMDNQRLPWAWDCLNRFEIAALNEAITKSTNHNITSHPEKQGAFIVWLLMATGQSIDRILTFGLAQSSSPSGALMPGPIYRRYLPTPPKAFRPTQDEKSMLFIHAEYVDLPLAPPLPLLVDELGLTDNKIKPIIEHQTVGTFLKLNSTETDKVVRQFLEAHRTREFRLLPGKIRNVLSNEIMRVSNDPVATHLLTALPSDMPPSGVYYTAYPPETLRRIYQTATSRIFGVNS